MYEQAQGYMSDLKFRIPNVSQPVETLSGGQAQGVAVARSAAFASKIVIMDEPMAALGKFFRQEGLYTFLRWHTFFTNPPLCITEADLREAFAIIDRGLEITDKAVS